VDQISQVPCKLLVSGALGHAAEYAFDGTSLKLDADLSYDSFGLNMPTHFAVNAEKRAAVAGLRDGAILAYDCDLWADDMTRFLKPLYRIQESDQPAAIGIICFAEENLLCCSSDFVRIFMFGGPAISAEQRVLIWDELRCLQHDQMPSDTDQPQSKPDHLRSPKGTPAATAVQSSAAAKAKHLQTRRTNIKKFRMESENSETVRQPVAFVYDSRWIQTRFI
jgi:hypothetical protein